MNRSIEMPSRSETGSRRHLGLAFIFGILLAGCSHADGSLAFAPRTQGFEASRAASLFVLDINNAGAITSYPVGDPARDNVITDGIVNALALGVDRSGTMYVANDLFDLAGHKPGNVVVYGAGRNTPDRTIVKGIDNPYAIAVDRDDNLYVANVAVSDPKFKFKSSVTVYPKNAVTPSRTITNGITSPQALAFDRAGNLYVVNNDGMSKHNSIVEYAPGRTTPIRAITAGLSNPKAVLVDRRGFVYAANDPWNLQSGLPENTSVVIYPPNGSKPIHTITQSSGGTYGPIALALDASENLYVANYGGLYCEGVTVTVFAPRSNTLQRTISKGISCPTALAFGSDGNLYVANSAGGNAQDGTVAVYRPGQSTPTLTYRRELRHPGAIAFGPP